MLSANAYQGHCGGLADYLNVRIYVADQATPGEIAAAANVAVRLTFEIHSIDLPIGFPLSRYDNSESSVAIFIGSAARRFAVGNTDSIIVSKDGTRNILAIPDIRDAELFARTLGSELGSQEVPDENAVRPPDKSFSLSSLFTSEGLLGDADGDQIPELTDTTIVLGPDVRSVEVINLAARIAFEAAGCRIPLVITDEAERLPSNPILIGRANRYLKDAAFHQTLQRLQQGQGRIEVIDATAGFGCAVVIAGIDDAGEAAALSHMAERLPFAWNYGKEHLHLAHVEKDLRYFFSQRSASGQSAAALCRAEELLEKLSSDELAAASLEVLVEGDPRNCMAEIQSRFPDLRVHAKNLGVGFGPLIFEETHDFPWEVDAARRRFMETVVPAIRSGSRVEVDLRISESPEIRRLLAGEFRKLALDLGANPEALRILIIAAHKQAYCWIDEVLKPRLQQSALIRIQYREIAPEAPGPVESTHRWLHELYPIDEILSRDLGIPLDCVTFKKSISQTVASCEVTAEDASGRVILQESFEPRYLMRKMFDSIPDYAQVRINTGWLHATVDGVVVADERVETDPEQFWNWYQSTTLRHIHQYLFQLYDGKPLPECAPHFEKLEVDLWLSEPDYRIGIGEERISTLEALHEDIYFETLLFFEILGLHNPGRIIPRVHHARDGQGGSARIRFTGKAGPNPRVDLTWKDKDDNSCRETENLFPLLNGDPKITALTVQSGHNSVVSLEVTGVPDTVENRARFGAVRRLHDWGYGIGLSYEYVDALRFGSIEIPKTAACFKTPRIEPVAGIDGNERTPLVQWDTPIGPQECEQIIRRLAAFPQVRAFHAATSYLGNPIWALEVVAPSRGKYVSQAKTIAAKPVLFITGRQHANEVSSTSHILKLAELLATDPEIRKLLEKVHFVLHPITNPDGAALVDELTGDTPDFMLHAGYLGALGSDVTTEQWHPYPQYPEAHVRPDLWRMWLPDIVLNPHGYPSHEWVQLFAGYTAWVKSRSVTARDWWIPRGWFVPGFAFMEQSRDAAFNILDRTTAAMKSHLGPWNEQMYRRYTKYGAHDPAVFRTQLCNGLLVYSPQKGLQPAPDGFTFMQRYPQITLLETVTEVPDEVAHGNWLKTLAEAGLEYSLANARGLAEISHAPERTIRHSAHSTTLRMRRIRPWQSAT